MRDSGTVFRERRGHCPPTPRPVWWPSKGACPVAIRRDEQYEGFDWQRDAACRGQHAPNFFPPPHFEPKALRVARERTAKAICRQCPVSDECLTYALESREPHGVWGGLNEAERRELLVGRGVGDERSGADLEPDLEPDLELDAGGAVRGTDPRGRGR